MALSRSTTIKLAPWVVVAALLLVWEAICIGFSIPQYLLPSPSDTWSAGVEQFGPIMMHAWQTFFTTLLGFALAVVLVLALVLLVGWSPLVFKVLFSVLVVFNIIL